MAFAVKYRAEFTDINGDDWTVNISEDGFVGAIATMQTTGNPLEIEYLTASDDLHSSPIKGSMAILNVECDTNFQYIGLYSSADMTYLMQVYCGATLRWQGWVSTDYTEPYDTPPYTVSINAADGLGMLKNIEFKDAGVEYTGRTREHLIILELLGKIGYTTFTEYVNMYEDRMADDVDDSPTTQLYIDQTAFRDRDCYTVLEEILKKYNAVIRQWNGQFIIYRPAELVEDTVYGRIITSGSVTATSMTPDQELRTATLEDTNGGVLMFKQPVSEFTAVQDYGNKESWLQNYLFNADTYDEDSRLFDYWSRIGLKRQYPVAHFLIKDETEGVGFVNVTNVPDSSSFIYQVFGTTAKTTTDTFRLSFDYRIVNVTGADVTNLDIVVIIADGTSTYYLELDGTDPDNYLAWNNGSSNINIVEATVPKGQGEWINFSRAIPGLPADGPYIIELFSTNQGCYLLMRDVRFYCTSDSIIVKKRKKNFFIRNFWDKLPIYVQAFIVAPIKFNFVKREYVDEDEIVSREYTAINAIEAPQLEQSYMLGDCTDTGITNVLEQFRGALAISLTGSLQNTAIDFVNDFAADYAALVSPSVILSSSGDTLYFESDTPGTNFTGATSITNASGNLAGTVSTIQANVVAVARRDEIELTGTGGEAYVTCSGMTRWMEYEISIDDTGAAFVTYYAADYLAIGVVLTYSNASNSLIFVANVAGVDFSGETTIENDLGNLTGNVSYVTPNITAKARKDQIVLSGTSGTANITCHGETNTITFNSAAGYNYTYTWHTRGNTEADQLLQIVADEMADLYSKGRQFVQLPLIENSGSFSMIGNVQDPLNLNGANTRVFVPNRGTFDVRNRQWTIDMIEIGEK